MSKKSFGKFLGLAAFAGAAAAGISYLVRYKSFSKELDEDFHIFEDESESSTAGNASRDYTALHADRDDLLVAAGDMLDAAKDMAAAAKNVVKDAASILSDNAHEAVNVAAETVANAKKTAQEMESDKKDDFADSEEAVTDTDDYVTEEAADIRSAEQKTAPDGETVDAEKSTSQDITEEVPDTADTPAKENILTSTVTIEEIDTDDL